MLRKLLDRYEDRKLYRANPCDVDAHSALAPTAKGFEALGSHCPCCSGVRVAAVAVLAAFFPVVTILGVALVFLWGAYKQ